MTRMLFLKWNRRLKTAMVLQALYIFLTHIFFSFYNEGTTSILVNAPLERGG